jgi:hypothetical protein
MVKPGEKRAKQKENENAQEDHQKTLFLQDED